MQLKLQRSQREGGMMSKTVIFCLDARVEFTAGEQQSITRYKLQNEVIYSSQATRRAAEGSAMSAANARAGGISVGSVDDMLSSATAKMGHGLKAAALGAMAAMNLTITINSLQKGQHIECKSLDELLGAEAAIMDACSNLRTYLDTAKTFDGREDLYEFTTGGMELIAASAPSPMLVAPAATATPALPAPTADQAPTESLDFVEASSSGGAPTLAGTSYSSADYDRFIAQVRADPWRYVLYAVALVIVLIVLKSCFSR